MSATSTRHAAALAEAIAEAADCPPSKIEGASQGEWVLLDLGDVIVHVFHEPVRAYYNLDKLWGHVPSIEPRTLRETSRASTGARTAL